MPDELYWRSTPHEVGELLKAMGERRQNEEEAAVLRAGLVAAAVLNVHRKKGAKPIQPRDFLRKKATRVLTAEDMRRWARTINQSN